MTMPAHVGEQIDLMKIDQVVVSVPEFEIFEFVWRIQDFSQVFGDKLVSPVFSSETGTTRWVVHIKTAKGASNPTTYVCIGLKLASTRNPFPFKVTYAYYFLNSEMKVQRGIAVRSFTIEGQAESTERPLCTKDEFLLGSEYLAHDGSLNLFFKVRVATSQNNADLAKNEDKESTILNWATICQTSFKSFIENETFADLTLATKTTTFPASKIILAAQSPVFRAMFCSPMREFKESLVEIEDVSDDVVQDFLEFLYTGSAQSDSLKVNVVELLKMSDKYGVVLLKQECEKLLVKELNKQNAADLLTLAHFYNSPQLTLQVVSFVKKFRREVSQTESFKQLKKSHPEILLDLYSEFD